MLQWWQQLVALACEHNRRMGDTMGSNRGNRHEHSDANNRGHLSHHALTPVAKTEKGRHTVREEVEKRETQGT